jgi:mRNA interferase HigB
MQLINVVALDNFKRDHADARIPLDAWRSEVEAAEWETPQEIKNRYRSVDFLANNRLIFNIKGNSYRLVVMVRYSPQLVVVEWIGTHAEYDKKRFE